MGFSFNFFGEQSHREFGYKPRYYNVEDEERKEFFAQKGRGIAARGLEQETTLEADAQVNQPGTALTTDQASATQPGTTPAGTPLQPGTNPAGPSSNPHVSSTAPADYKPGQYISGSFRDGNYQRSKLVDGTKTHKLIGMVGLGLFFAALILLAMNYSKLLEAMALQQEKKAAASEYVLEYEQPELYEHLIPDND